MSTSSWNQLGQDINGESLYDNSGWSVSLSSDGKIVAIGAPLNDGNGSNSGQVRVYKLNNDNSWNQIGQDIDGESSSDNSGWSVSLSSDGSTVAIGAPLNIGNGSYSGQVRVYKFNNILWTQIGQDIDGEGSWDPIGYSVSLNFDGSIVAISSPYNSRYGTYIGQVKVYNFINNSWVQIGENINGEALLDKSGWSVFLSSDGSTVAIGAPLNDGNGTNSGQVRVYKYNNNLWSKIGQDIDGEASWDQSGWSVSLSSNGSTVAIGAPKNARNGSNAGQVRVYNFINNFWTQIGQDIDSERLMDDCGWSVSLSYDGLTVAIGSPKNNDNGQFSGLVRIYKFNNNYWTQIGQDIDGKVSWDYSGYYVSLNYDGSIVAIGSPNNISNRGQVRVYKLISTSVPISNICFPEKTPVRTDQGLIHIDKINPDLHTIRNKKIVAITKTITQDKYLVCFEKDSLGPNVPSEKTFISKVHLILHKGKMTKAKEFIGKYENVYKVKYNGEILYNVLLEEYDKIIINNLICETLHPENAAAKLYKIISTMTIEEQINSLKIVTDIQLKNKIFYN